MRTSVALTTYNGNKYIIEQLDSILRQTEQPDEVVIVDDCSIDDTYSIVNKYIEEKKLTTWHNYRNVKNIGWKANFRQVFKKCTGDIVFLCDQDDIWKPFKVFEMKRVMDANHNIGLLASNFEVLYMDRTKKVAIHGINKDDGSVQRVKCSKKGLSTARPGCTYCVRKELIDLLLKRDVISAAHDKMLWSYAIVGESLYLYNRKTIEYRRHSESATAAKIERCRSRRIADIALNSEILSLLVEECKNNGCDSKVEFCFDLLRFNMKRKELLENRSIVNMVKFQLLNINRYPTIKNMLSDYYMLLVKPN